ncbi:thioredoxin fold domain-containing protein [Candidatus Fukatsuia symbiotica]|uniref:Conjugal transfer protein TrbB n=1 Tax=Candidatus Fukatsuia symbiotica TaxID=1878942 RepID=A0A2U8I9J9_9GAMM|nr:thioredoxin fold domain-containing protein [Candidatus Fukatsuia symbiotica]AWK15728.1 conjugal transfer protein TrbB [Candidatus Fukatsuia symbiotica]MEA9446093.1 thioredoxin fold domain-containing protein [Candidatus Fukatsuia symbiotica]
MLPKTFFTHIIGSILTTRIDHADNGSVLFTLDMSQETHFFMQDNHLIIRQNNLQDIVILDERISPADARHLLNTLTDALIKHQKIKLLRRRIVWSLIFIAIIIAVCGQRLLPTTPPIQTSLLQPSDQQPAPWPLTPSVTETVQLPTLEPYREPALTIQPPSPAWATLANNLRDAAGRKLFTVPLTTDHSRTLYVFSDPLCPHCRDIEPTLAAIGKNYNVEIFPVTLVGKQQTATQVIPVLCALPENRLALWKALFNDSPHAQEPSCDIGEKALAVNDKAFAAYGFPGTPQLIADDGRPVPFSALENDEKLAAFMNANPEK